jgi:putative aldouronate transport system permease protein
VGLYQSLFGFAFVMAANWVVRRINKDYALF